MTGRGWALAVVAGLGLIVPAAFGGNAVDAARPAFCKGAKLRDLEAPLRGLPGERPPPEGELPFGPRNLTIYRLNFGSKVVLAGSHLGYRFGAKRPGSRTLDVRWDVLATMRRVNRRGKPMGRGSAIRRRLPTVEDLRLLQFSFPARPGMYRIELRFSNLRGRKLGSYIEYFRVVPRKVRLKLAVRERVLLPGDVAHARVLNLGTVPVSVRPGLPVERDEGSCWVEQPNRPIPARSVKRFRWTLYAAEASPCVAFRIPADAEPGLYRYTASVLVFGKRGRRTLTTVFRVRASES